LQKLKENEQGIVYLDFAHSPSKVKATVDAVSARYPGRDIIACLELHTFSSLSENFLPLYKGTLAGATHGIVYFNPHAIELKKLKPITGESVAGAFAGNNIKVFSNSDQMFAEISLSKFKNPVYLFMSSGDFNGFDLSMMI